ncbi:MAG: FG-GAP repeat protein, partial [Chloroflexota bacterium]
MSLAFATWLDRHNIAPIRIRWIYLVRLNIIAITICAQVMTPLHYGGVFFSLRGWAVTASLPTRAQASEWFGSADHAAAPTDEPRPSAWEMLTGTGVLDTLPDITPGRAIIPDFDWLIPSVPHMGRSVPANPAPASERVSYPGETTASTSGDWDTVWAGFEAAEVDETVAEDALAIPVAQTMPEFEEFTSTVIRTGDRFGEAVSIDGNVIVVGAPEDDAGDGVVFVFENVGGNWQEFTIPEPDNFSIFDHYAEAVAAGDDKVVLSAPGESSGMIYTYTRQGNSWQLVATQSPPIALASNAEFGRSLDISDNRLIVGAPFDTTAFIYDWDSASDAWVSPQQLTPSDGANFFGGDVAIDGDRAVVGNGESIYIFQFDGTSWVEEALLSIDPLGQYT